VSTQLLILVIAAVGGTSAIVGYALGQFSDARRLRDTQAARDRVPEKFKRGNRPRGRQSGVGAGFGLSLVKSFVELHGGDVQIESEPDEGTAIVGRLPRRSQTPAPEGNAV
jgi:hypothetical protein